MNAAVVNTPFGRALYIACDDRGVATSRWTTARPQPMRAHHGDVLLAQALQQLRGYFEGRLARFDVPLSLTGTPFEVEVWSAVAMLSCGALVSYADVAHAVGRPNAHRGVARALARAPLTLFIPAHRVVGADGRIKGAAVGSMRRRLIAFERRLSEGALPSGYPRGGMRRKKR